MNRKNKLSHPMQVVGVLVVTLFTAACGHSYYHQPTTRVMNFNQADRNRDSALNFYEYQMFVSLEAKAGNKYASKIVKMDMDGSHEILKRKFHALDMNGDGLLTSAELNAV